jgi:copper chaperone CopZ
MSQHDELHAATTLSVSGMTCGGCVNAVTRILSRVPGVAAVAVDLKSGHATVRGGAAPADLIAAVEAAGYGAKAIEG